jgi:hypothetical protein
MMSKLNGFPLVSVVIPAYNAAAYLQKAIESVLQQSYQNIELIIVDDGSTDATWEIAARYQNSHIKLVQKQNGGLSSARNAGIRESTGDYIAYLDADDFWAPEKILRQLEIMQLHPEIGFTSTATKVESPEGDCLNIWPCPVETDSFLELLFSQNGSVAGSGSSVMVRRELQLAAGFFDEALKSLEDIDMWMRLASLGRYACVPEVLTTLLKRPGSMSRHLHVMRDSALTVMRKNRALLPPAKRGAFWRDGMAGVLCDYAKWEARSGKKWGAILHILQGFILSPARKARLCAALIVAILNPWAKF